MSQQQDDIRAIARVWMARQEESDRARRKLLWMSALCALALGIAFLTRAA